MHGTSYDIRFIDVQTHCSRTVTFYFTIQTSAPNFLSKDKIAVKIFQVGGKWTDWQTQRKHVSTCSDYKIPSCSYKHNGICVHINAAQRTNAHSRPPSSAPLRSPGALNQASSGWVCLLSFLSSVFSFSLFLFHRDKSLQVSQWLCRRMWQQECLPWHFTPFVSAAVISITRTRLSGRANSGIIMIMDGVYWALKDTSLQSSAVHRFTTFFFSFFFFLTPKQTRNSRHIPTTVSWQSWNPDLRNVNIIIQIKTMWTEHFPDIIWKQSIPPKHLKQQEGLGNEANIQKREKQTLHKGSAMCSCPTDSTVKQRFPNCFKRRPEGNKTCFQFHPSRCSSFHYIFTVALNIHKKHLCFNYQEYSVVRFVHVFSFMLPSQWQIQ